MACYVTSVMMRAEFSILGLVEIVGGLAIAAAVCEIADKVAVRPSDRSWLPECCWDPGSHSLYQALR